MTGATLVIQATSSPRARTRGRHRKQTSRRWVSISKPRVLGGVAALLAVFGLLAGLAVKWMHEAPQPVADPPQPLSPTTAVPIEVTPSEPAQAQATIESAAPFATDDKGFVNSNARCEGSKRAAAIGRTERSFVVICAGENGRYEYLGVRISDYAVLRTAAESTPSRGFLARNASVTYTVSATELLVMAGARVIKQEPMIEYRGSDSTRPASR